jgi:hypothetical protein
LGCIDGGAGIYECMQAAAVMIDVVVVGWAGKEAVKQRGVVQHVQRVIPFFGRGVVKEFFQSFSFRMCLRQCGCYIDKF